MATRYTPAQGDAVWITLSPQSGHEQAGRRPAIVLSPSAYNARVGLCLICPITSQVKGYSYEVVLPHGLPLSGAVLSDQVRSLDWRTRRAEFVCALPEGVTRQVTTRLGTLLMLEIA